MGPKVSSCTVQGVWSRDPSIFHFRFTWSNPLSLQPMQWYVQCLKIYIYNWLLLFHTGTKDNERGKDNALTAERGEGIWTHETTAKKVEASSNTIPFLYAMYCIYILYVQLQWGLQDKLSPLKNCNQDLQYSRWMCSIAQSTDIFSFFVGSIEVRGFVTMWRERALLPVA